MLFIGNLLTDYYHSFIHSYSPFLTLLTLPLRSRRADFVLFVFLSLFLMPTPQSGTYTLLNRPGSSQQRYFRRCTHLQGRAQG